MPNMALLPGKRVEARLHVLADGATSHPDRTAVQYLRNDNHVCEAFASPSVEQKPRAQDAVIAEAPLMEVRLQTVSRAVSELQRFRRQL